MARAIAGNAPASPAPNRKRVKLKSFDGKPLILFHRHGAPELYDSITALCREAGFVPRVEHEPKLMQTVLTLVASEAGSAIIPACVSTLRADGVRFMRIDPDHELVELIAAWHKGPTSVVLRSFLDLLEEETATILTKVASHLP